LELQRAVKGKGESGSNALKGFHYQSTPKRKYHGKLKKPRAGSIIRWLIKRLKKCGFKVRQNIKQCQGVSKGGILRVVLLNSKRTKKNKLRKPNPAEKNCCKPARKSIPDRKREKKQQRGRRGKERDEGAVNESSKPGVQRSKDCEGVLGSSER